MSIPYTRKWKEKARLDEKLLKFMTPFKISLLLFLLNLKVQNKDVKSEGKKLI